MLRHPRCYTDCYTEDETVTGRAEDGTRTRNKYPQSEHERDRPNSDPSQLGAGHDLAELVEKERAAVRQDRKST